MAKNLKTIKDELTTEKPDEKTPDDKTTETPAPKKTRRRRVKKKPQVLPPESTTSLLDVIFNVVAARAGEHWKLKPEESLAGGQALNAVAVKWTPTIVKYQEETALATWIIMILLPRLDLESLFKKVKKPQVEEEKKEPESKDKPLAAVKK